MEGEDDHLVFFGGPGFALGILHGVRVELEVVAEPFPSSGGAQEPHALRSNTP